MKRKFAAAVLAAAMLAMSLAGCSAPSSSQAPGSASATASAPAQDDGRKVLTIAQGGDITTFDMQNHNNGVTGAVLGNFSHGLVERADEDNSWVCVLAESYETIDDSTWEFKLRDDVTWHNGDPFTAADVKWTLERVATDESLAENHIFSVIKEVQVVDDYTVRIITDGPYPTMLSLLSKNGSQMMPSKYIEENGLDYYLENPIGCGPYKFKEWVKDDVVVLERYDDYFGGTPYWDEVRFRAIPEASTRVAELLTGNVDIIVNVPTNEWERIDEGENTEMVLGNGTRIYNVIMKWDSTPTQNKQVREAVAMVKKFPQLAFNMDLIAGLPGDTPESFSDTVREVIALGAENITVHTLALKKGSRFLTEGTALPDGKAVGEMLGDAREKLEAAGYAPYYLYRQKFMSGSFENVGWTKPGYENLYNICIMEELCGILAVGAGGSTKLTAPGGVVKRLMAPKYPREYMDRIAHTCAEKDEIVRFYNSEPKGTN